MRSLGVHEGGEAVQLDFEGFYLACDWRRPDAWEDGTFLETLTEWAYNAGGRDKPWFSVEDWNWLPEENP